MAATGFFSAFLIGCAIALVGLLFLDPICRALGSTPTILPYAKTYLGIILLGAPFMASSLVLNNQMRFQGNAVYAMIGIIVGAVLNIGLDPLLIFVFNMGIAEFPGRRLVRFSGMQLHHPAFHGTERRKHPYSLPAFYSDSSLSERNPIRRKSFSLP